MSLDWAAMFHMEWSITFLLAMLNIVFINIILSGDNAVLIAMAVRGLPKEQRKKGVLFGTAAAVLLRGVSRNSDQQKRLEAEIRKMTGETTVECHIHYRGSWPFRGI